MSQNGQTHIKNLAAPVYLTILALNVIKKITDKHTQGKKSSQLELSRKNKIIRKLRDMFNTTLINTNQ